MLHFIKGVLSEQGQPSSKRVAFFVLLFLFVGVCVYNIITGKMLTPTLQDQLYYMLTASLLAILGSNVITAVKDVKTSGTQQFPEPSTTQPGAQTNTEIKVS